MISNYVVSYLVNNIAIYNYLSQKKLRINIDKTKYELISYKNVNVAANEYKVMINAVSLESVSGIKYLSVIINSKLNFHSYANYTLEKMWTKCYIINRKGKKRKIVV